MERFLMTISIVPHPPLTLPFDGGEGEEVIIGTVPKVCL
jgi:hypothetical protein